MSHPDNLQRVLFVCVENSCRSQMAEAFARIHGRGHVKAYSSGSSPSGVVNERAIQFMLELDYDLATHHSKSLSELPQVEWDAVIAMGCGDKCPLLPAKVRDDWNIADPKEVNDESFREIRDMIEGRVIALIQDLKDTKSETA